MTTKQQFFQVMPVSEALELVTRHIGHQLPTETLPTRAALGRVLAQAPISPHDLPEFPRSTMDGYAVRAQDTFGASQALPAYLHVVGSVQMGGAPDVQVTTAQAVEIHTGAMLPEGADAVIMVEHTQTVSEKEIEVLSPVAPGENVVQVGEDVAQGAEVLPVGHRLRPQDLGGLLAVGLIEVTVSARPRVALLSSGDELVPPEQMPVIGQIRDINAYALGALIEQGGAEVVFGGIARDNFDEMLAKAQDAFASADMLVLTAGSSISTRDLTRDVINALGKPGILQHGLAVKPGKPTIFAVCDGKPVIGLPGNPVSAFLVARQIVLPLIRRLQGERVPHRATVSATLMQNIPSKSGREDTVPVSLTQQADGLYAAEPIFGKSNLIFTLIRADGLVHVPLNTGGLKAGDRVDVTLF